MDSYLSSLKKQLDKKTSSSTRIHVVIGNEACDLDSAVSAIIYAYYLAAKNNEEDLLIVPLLNIPQNQFRLRTETTSFFQKLNISAESLVFKDQLDLGRVYHEERLLLTLVDHNVLTGADIPYEDCVVEVLDHHVPERPENERVRQKLDFVGSCCTLVAEELLSDTSFVWDEVTAELLYGTILVDTINRSPDAGKITPRDEAVLCRLEAFLPDIKGDDLFEALQAAKFDISGLLNMEILEKDLKMVPGTAMTIAMSSVTMEMTELLDRPSFKNDLDEFCQKQKCEVVVIMTLINDDDGKPTRQIAVYSENRIYRDQIADTLDNSLDVDLDLELQMAPFDDITVFQQGNVKASRKKVMPILKSFLHGDITPDVSSKDFVSQHSVTASAAGFSHLEVGETESKSEKAGNRVTFTLDSIDAPSVEEEINENEKDVGSYKNFDSLYLDSPSHLDATVHVQQQTTQEHDILISSSKGQEVDDITQNPSSSVFLSSAHSSNLFDFGISDSELVDPFSSVEDSTKLDSSENSPKEKKPSQSSDTETKESAQANVNSVDESENLQGVSRNPFAEELPAEIADIKIETKDQNENPFLTNDANSAIQNVNFQLDDFNENTSVALDSDDVSNVNFSNSNNFNSQNFLDVNTFGYGHRPAQKSTSLIVECDAKSQADDLAELEESELFDKVPTPEAEHSGENSPFVLSGVNSPFINSYTGTPYHSRTASDSGTGLPEVAVPPNSLMDLGFGGSATEVGLPSFNSAEMVERIHKKKASLNIGADLFDLGEHMEELSTPYTPQNSYREEGMFIHDVRDNSLPDLLDSDFLEKVQQKRDSLSVNLKSGENDENQDVKPAATNPFADFLDLSETSVETNVPSTNPFTQLSKESLEFDPFAPIEPWTDSDPSNMPSGALQQDFMGDLTDLEAIKEEHTNVDILDIFGASESEVTETHSETQAGSENLIDIGTNFVTPLPMVPEQNLNPFLVDFESNQQTDQEVASDSTNEASAETEADQSVVSMNMDQSTLEALNESANLEAAHAVSETLAKEIIHDAIETFPDVSNPRVASEMVQQNDVDWTEQGSGDSGIGSTGSPQGPKLQSGARRLNSDYSVETEYLPNMDPLHGSLNITSNSSRTQSIETDADKEVVEGESFRKVSGEERTPYNFEEHTHNRMTPVKNIPETIKEMIIAQNIQSASAAGDVVDVQYDYAGAQEDNAHGETGENATENVVKSSEESDFSGNTKEHESRDLVDLSDIGNEMLEMNGESKCFEEHSDEMTNMIEHVKDEILKENIQSSAVDMNLSNSTDNFVERSTNIPDSFSIENDNRVIEIESENELNKSETFNDQPLVDFSDFETISSPIKTGLQNFSELEFMSDPNRRESEYELTDAFDSETGSEQKSEEINIEKSGDKLVDISTETYEDEEKEVYTVKEEDPSGDESFATFQETADIGFDNKGIEYDLSDVSIEKDSESMIEEERNDEQGDEQCTEAMETEPIEVQENISPETKRDFETTSSPVETGLQNFSELEFMSDPNRRESEYELTDAFDSETRSEQKSDELHIEKSGAKLVDISTETYEDEEKEVYTVKEEDPSGDESFATFQETADIRFDNKGIEYDLSDVSIEKDSESMIEEERNDEQEDEQCTEAMETEPIEVQENISPETKRDFETTSSPVETGLQNFSELEFMSDPNRRESEYELTDAFDSETGSEQKSDELHIEKSDDKLVNISTETCEDEEKEVYTVKEEDPPGDESFATFQETADIGFDNKGFEYDLSDVSIEKDSESMIEEEEINDEQKDEQGAESVETEPIEVPEDISPETKRSESDNSISSDASSSFPTTSESESELITVRENTVTQSQLAVDETGFITDEIIDAEPNGDEPKMIESEITQVGLGLSVEEVTVEKSEVEGETGHTEASREMQIEDESFETETSKESENEYCKDAENNFIDIDKPLTESSLTIESVSPVETPFCEHVSGFYEVNPEQNVGNNVEDLLTSSAFETNLGENETGFYEVNKGDDALVQSAVTIDSISSVESPEHEKVTGLYEVNAELLELAIEKDNKYYLQIEDEYSDASVSPAETPETENPKGFYDINADNLEKAIERIDSLDLNNSLLVDSTVSDDSSVSPMETPELETVDGFYDFDANSRNLIDINATTSDETNQGSVNTTLGPSDAPAINIELVESPRSSQDSFDSETELRFAQSDSKFIEEEREISGEKEIKDELDNIDDRFSNTGQLIDDVIAGTEESSHVDKCKIDFDTGPEIKVEMMGSTDSIESNESTDEEFDQMNAEIQGTVLQNIEIGSAFSPIESPSEEVFDMEYEINPMVQDLTQESVQSSEEEYVDEGTKPFVRFCTDENEEKFENMAETLVETALVEAIGSLQAQYLKQNLITNNEAETVNYVSDLGDVNPDSDKYLKMADGLVNEAVTSAIEIVQEMKLCDEGLFITSEIANAMRECTDSSDSEESSTTTEGSYRIVNSVDLSPAATPDREEITSTDLIENQSDVIQLETVDEVDMVSDKMVNNNTDPVTENEFDIEQMNITDVIGETPLPDVISFDTQYINDENGNITEELTDPNLNTDDLNVVNADQYAYENFAVTEKGEPNDISDNSKTLARQETLIPDIVISTEATPPPSSDENEYETYKEVTVEQDSGNVNDETEIVTENSEANQTNIKDTELPENKVDDADNKINEQESDSQSVTSQTENVVVKKTLIEADEVAQVMINEKQMQEGNLIGLDNEADVEKSVKENLPDIVSFDEIIVRQEPEKLLQSIESGLDSFEDGETSPASTETSESKSASEVESEDKGRVSEDENEDISARNGVQKIQETPHHNLKDLESEKDEKKSGRAKKGQLEYVTRKEIFYTSAGRMSISIDSVVDPPCDSELSYSVEQDIIHEETQEAVAVSHILARANSAIDHADEVLSHDDEASLALMHDGAPAVTEGCIDIVAADVEANETDEDTLSDNSQPVDEDDDTSEKHVVIEKVEPEKPKPSHEKMKMDDTQEWHEDPIPGMGATTQDSSSDESDTESDSEYTKPARPDSLLNGTRRKKKIAANNFLSPDSTDDLVEGVDDIPTPDDLETPSDIEGEGLEWEDDTPITPTSDSKKFSEYRDDEAEREKYENTKFRKVEIAGKDYRVDMKVIEPYKKVLSHGGYYGDGLNAIILFCGCYLPDRGRSDYQYVMDNLFLYVISTLELLVAEDYMIVYFHGATPRRQMPSFGWLKRCYQMIDRRLRKNLKALLMVHPTLWLKTVVMMTKPFISSKFSSKLRFVKTLQELAKIVPMEYIYVPEPVSQYDGKLTQHRPCTSASDTPSPPS